MTFSELLETNYSLFLNKSNVTFIKMANISTAQNSTRTESAGLQPGPEKFIVPLLFSLIFLIGTVGNGTLIWIVMRNKSMRNVPNVYIVSLALGDLLLLLVSVPFTATIYTFTEWPYGAAMCKINEFLQTLSLGVSVFTLTALSGDRYTAIVKPMQKRAAAGLRNTLGISAAIWFLSGTLALPDAIGAHLLLHRFESHTLHLCVLYPHNWPAWYAKFHTATRFVLYFAIPVAIIAIFYILMASTLMKNSSILTGQGDPNQIKQIQARKRLAKVVLSFVLVFILCWLPRYVYMFWFHFDPGVYNLGWHIFKIIGFCLSFLNSCVNPVALYFLSKQFRKYYNMYLLCWCWRNMKIKRSQISDKKHSSVFKFTSSQSGNSTSYTNTSPYKRLHSRSQTVNSVSEHINYHFTN